MRAAVAHHFWDQAGGGELVSSAVARILADLLGEENVLIISLFDFDPHKYAKWFGIDITRIKRVAIRRLRTRYFEPFMKLIFPEVVLRKVLERTRLDLLFIDIDTYGHLMRTCSLRPRWLVEYVHYEIVTDEKFRDKDYYWKNDLYHAKYRKFPWNLYFRVWLLLYRRVKRENPFYYADLVLTNSRWNARIIREVYGAEPIVLPPPIPPATRIPALGEVPDFDKREPVVIMLGRLSPEKRYDWVIQNVAPELARHGVKLVIIGSRSHGLSDRYRQKLIKLIRKLSLEQYVIILSDLSRSEVNKYLDRARVFLHATLNEHWGVAVAEAMARGLPVVVHKSGGTWTDLLEEGVYGLGYDTAEECVEQVLKLITDEQIWRRYSRLGIIRAREFTFDMFKRRFVEILRRLDLPV